MCNKDTMFIQSVNVLVMFLHADILTLSDEKLYPVKICKKVQQICNTRINGWVLLASEKRHGGLYKMLESKLK